MDHKLFSLQITRWAMVAALIIGVVVAAQYPWVWMMNIMPLALLAVLDLIYASHLIQNSDEGHHQKVDHEQCKREIYDDLLEELRSCMQEARHEVIQEVHANPGTSQNVYLTTSDMDEAAQLGIDEILQTASNVLQATSKTRRTKSDSPKTKPAAGEPQDD